MQFLKHFIIHARHVSYDTLFIYSSYIISGWREVKCMNNLSNNSYLSFFFLCMDVVIMKDVSIQREDLGFREIQKPSESLGKCRWSKCETRNDIYSSSLTCEHEYKVIIELIHYRNTVTNREWLGSMNYYTNCRQTWAVEIVLVTLSCTTVQSKTLLVWYLQHQKHACCYWPIPS